MKILKAMVVKGYGADKVFLTTDLPEGCWPYTSALTFSFDVAQNDGYCYVLNNWPGIPTEVVERSKSCAPFAKDPEVS